MFVSPSLNLLNKIVLFATCLVLTWSQGPKDSARLEAFYIDVFHKALGDVRTLNVTMAMSALQRMTDFKSVQLPLKSTGRNVIHHSLDLYMQSRSNVVRKDIVGLLLALIDRGAVVQEEHDESPDIVTKALIIRELALASAFISAGHPKEVSSLLLRELYSIQSEVVPLSKLLLRAHTTILSKPNGPAYYGGLSGIQVLLAGAALTPGAQPAVKGSDFQSMSSTYNKVISTLGLKSFTDSGLRYTDVISILEESVGAIQSKLFKENSTVVEVTTEDGGRRQKLKRGTGTDINMDKVMDMKSISLRTNIFLEADGQRRNVLHVLSLSGGVEILNDLVLKYSIPLMPSQSFQSSAISSFCTSSSADYFRDIGASVCWPFYAFYSALRALIYPPSVTVTTPSRPLSRQQSIGIADTVMFTEALRARDVWGSTPVTYVQSRCGHEGNERYLELMSNIKFLFSSLNVFEDDDIKGVGKGTVDDDASDMRDVETSRTVEIDSNGGISDMEAEVSIGTGTDTTLDTEHKPIGYGDEARRREGGREEFAYNTEEGKGQEPGSESGSESGSAAGQEVHTERDSGSSSVRVSNSDGGWNTSSIDPSYRTETARCDFQEIDFKSFGPTFFKDIILSGKPVLMRGAALGTEIQDVFSRDVFLKHFGDFEVPLSALPYAESFGEPSYRSSLTRVSSLESPPIGLTEGQDSGSVPGMEEEEDRGRLKRETPLYTFSTVSPRMRDLLDVLVPLPSFLKDFLSAAGSILGPGSDHVDTQLYLGPMGSGAPVHFHTHALNVLAYGEKRWMLFPPHEAFYSVLPALELTRRDLRAQSSLQCTQQAGDIVFVPKNWGHATLNIRQSIGLAYELSIPL